MPQFNAPAHQPQISGQPVAVELHHEVEQFVYYDARLLEVRRFEEKIKEAKPLPHRISCGA